MPERPYSDPPDFRHHVDPPNGLPDSDLRTRWGELTPLYSKQEHFYEGVAIGALTMQTVSATALFLPRNAEALSATLQVQAQPIRYTVDGTIPTATVGFRSVADSIIRVTGTQDLLAFQMIREGATDATVAIQFWS